MKKNILISIILLLFFNSNLFGQNIFANNPTLEINGRTYKCLFSISEVYVFNANQPLIQGSPGIPALDCVLPILNRTSIRQKIQEVFSPERETFLRSIKEDCVIDIYIIPSTGQVCDLQFTIDPNSQLTLQEVYLLENKLKTLIMSQNTECHPGNYMHHSFPLFKY